MQTNVSARKLRNIGSRSRADAVFPLTPTLSPRACHYPQVRLPFLNPKGIVSSSPGLRAASYPGKRESRKHPTPTRLRLQATTGGRNPVGVGVFWSSSPRVARCSQPWALRRNPFGIRLLDDATCGECSALTEREHRSQSLGISGRAKIGRAHV